MFPRVLKMGETSSGERGHEAPKAGEGARTWNALSLRDYDDPPEDVDDAKYLDIHLREQSFVGFCIVWRDKVL